MSRRLNLQLIRLALILNFLSSYPVSSESAELPPFQQQPQRNYLSHETNPLPIDKQTPKRPQFFKLLLERLEARSGKTNESNSLPLPDHLTLTLRDGASNTVSIEFSPNTLTPEQEQGWDSIINLLADSLAHIIEVAENQGYNAHSSYTLSLDDIPTGVGYASVTALKSAAG